MFPMFRDFLTPPVAVVAAALPDVTVEHPEIEADGFITVHAFPALAITPDAPTVH